MSNYQPKNIKNIKNISISDFTKFEEILDGRVKTLHPKIHAGILAKGQSSLKNLKDKTYELIDIVVVNLYPFEEAVSKKNCTFENAIENQNPFICVSAGGGMRMMESLISLSQMTRTTLAINELKSKNLPYLVLITDPTAGGITASYAMLGDIHIAEPGSLIAFAGKRVIQGTVKEELPENFQTSEYVQKTGFVDLIVERKDLSKKIGTLLSILLKKNSDISTEENETKENTQSLSQVAS